MLLSSGDPGMYDGALFSLNGDFVDFLKLQNMGVFTVHGEGEIPEETLREIYHAGRSLKDSQPNQEEMTMSNYYIAPLDEAVQRLPVRYRNRYGMEIAGEVYTRRDMDKDEKHPAIIVGAPYGGVKEQGPCVYGSELAKRGFVVLTFDQSFMGESGGEPRHVSSPDIFTENFSAGVDFLGLQSYVDRERIGAIGICGSGGFALSAAQVDTRIRAVATCSMYDMSAARLGLDAEGIQAAKERLSRQRWADAENGAPEYNPFFPETPLDAVPDGMEEPNAEWFRFYAVKRGHHPNARGGFTTTSDLTMMNYPLLSHIDEISPRPILFVMGDRAHSRFFSLNAYAAAKEPKRILNVADAEHIDLYDRVDRIPFDDLAAFFREMG